MFVGMMVRSYNKLLYYLVEEEGEGGGVKCSTTQSDCKFS